MKRAFGALAALTVLFCAPLIFGSGFVANAGDIFDYAAPFRAWASLQLQGGRFPLWNPWIFAGAPFLASPQSALFYPLTALFTAMPLAPAFRAFTVAHFFLMGAGFWLWLRARGAGVGGALAASVAAVFSFFFLSKVAAGHVIHLSGYAWTPYVLLLGEALKRRPRSSVLPWLWASASALQFFSGHLQVWLVTHVILLGLVVDRSLFRWKTFRPAGAALLALAALAAVQALPTAEYLPRTTRGLTDLLSPGDREAFATSYSMSPALLVKGWLRPWAWGSPVDVAQIFPGPLSHYYELAAVFMGWSGLALAAAGLALLIWRRRWRLPLLAGISLCLSLGKNGPLYPFLWKSLAWLRVPGRFYLGFHVAAAAAAAAAWRAWARGRRLRWALFLLMSGELWFFGRGFLRVQDPGPRLEKTALVAWLQDRLGRGVGAGRLLTTSSVGNANKGMIFGLPNIDGYEALVPGALWRRVAATQPGVVQTTTGLAVARIEEPLLGALGLRFVLSGTPLSTSWPVAWQGGDLRVYENPAPEPLVRVAGTLQRAWRISAEKFKCRWRAADGNSSAVWAESWAPGWRAWTRQGETDNGAVHGLLQRVDVAGPPGDREVWWLYRPRSFRWGLLATLAALAAGALTLGREFVRRGGRRP